MTSTALKPGPPRVVERFDGKYEFLSNFWLSPITWEGRQAPSVEHHYSAAKTLNEIEREIVYARSTPGRAKRAGQEVTLRPGWEDGIKTQVMSELCHLKFADPELKAMLLDTEDALLVEGNHWHDQHWGECHCGKHRPWPGQNLLGRMLMNIRAEARGDDPTRYVRVAVTGHRSRELNPEEIEWIKQALKEVAVRLRDEHQTRIAISGMAQGVDTWWSSACLAAGLELWSYIPFWGQSARWSEHAAGVYEDLRAQASREVILGNEPSIRLFHERNGLMVRDADLVVAVHHPSKTTGGTAECIRRARKAGRPMLRLNVATQEITWVLPKRTDEKEEGKALF